MATAKICQGFLGCSRALGDFRFKACCSWAWYVDISPVTQEDAALLPEQQKAMSPISLLFFCAFHGEWESLCLFMPVLGAMICSNRKRSRPCQRSMILGSNTQSHVFVVRSFVCPSATGIWMSKRRRNRVGVRWSLRCAQQQQGLENAKFASRLFTSLDIFGRFAAPSARKGQCTSA